MKLNLIQDPTGLGRGEGFIQTRSIMSVQVILNQANLLSLGIIVLHQIPNAFRIVTPRAAGAHFHVTPPP